MFSTFIFATFAAFVICQNIQAADASFRDCEDCPDMMIVPPGSFDMGSLPEDKERFPDEGPVHTVTINKAFAVGMYEITRQQFRHFISGSGYKTVQRCNILEGLQWNNKTGVDWHNPGYEQTAEEPVVCVSWDDAREYIKWLSHKTGKKYRLLSEAEWEYAAKANHPDTVITHNMANYGLKECCGPKKEGKDSWGHTSPVGSFAANAFGLYDMQGNVWEWVEDCYHDSYEGAPVNGSARTTNCSLADRRIVRGGSWGDDRRFLRPSYRLRAAKDNQYFTLGFRVARDL